jgi:hypothetical protein
LRDQPDPRGEQNRYDNYGAQKNRYLLLPETHAGAG